jgi:hypothetical protein
MKMAWIVLLASSTTIGCASMSARRVPLGEVSKAGEPAEGVVYSLAQPSFSVDVKDQHKDEAATPAYDIHVGFKADPEQRFEVGLSRGWVTKDHLELNLTDDGRLASINAASEDFTAELIKPLGQLVVSAGQAAAALSEEDPLTDAFNRECGPASGEHKVLKADRCSPMKAVMDWIADQTRDRPAKDVFTAATSAAATLRSKKYEEHLRKDLSGRRLTTLEVTQEVGELMRWVRAITGFEVKVKAQITPDPDKKAQKVVDELIERFKTLRADVDKTLAAYILKPNDEHKKKFKDAMDAYTTALDSLLEADTRGLRARKSALLDLMKAGPGSKPVDAFAKAYVALRSEFDRLDEEIVSMIPTEPKPKKAPLPGTDVTKTYDALPALYLDFPDSKSIEDVAEAWYRFGPDAWLRDTEIRAAAIYFRADAIAKKNAEAKAQPDSEKKDPAKTQEKNGDAK